MNAWLNIVTAVLVVFGVVGVGVAARYVGWLTKEADETLLKLVIRVLMPALIFHVILANDSLREPRNILLPPLVGFGTAMLGFAVAAGVAHLGRRWLHMPTAPQRRTFTLCVGLYNYGYVPLPLAIALFDINTVGVLFVHNVGIEIAVWTVGVMIVSGELGRRWWRHLLNPPVLAIAVALPLNALNVHDALPPLASQVLDQSLEMLGRCAIPMSLLLIGATVADAVRSVPIAQGGRVIAASWVLRLALLPVMFFALAFVLPMSIELKRVLIIQAAMPSAVFPIVIARLYHGDVPTALRVVLGTALLSLLTTPLWLSAGMALFDLGGQ